MQGNSNIDIGYDINKATILMNKVAETQQEISEVFNSSWKKLSLKMQKEWIGPDESNAEAELALITRDAFVEISRNISEAVKRVYEMIQEWQNFEIQNEFSGAIGIKEDVTLPSIEVNDVFVKDTIVDPMLSFSPDIILGILNESSPENIGSAIKEFLEEIRFEIDKMFKNIETNEVFKGNAQEEALVNYLNKIAQQLKGSLKEIEIVKPKLIGMAALINVTASQKSREINNWE